MSGKKDRPASKTSEGIYGPLSGGAKIKPKKAAGWTVHDDGTITATAAALARATRASDAGKARARKER